MKTESKELMFVEVKCLDCGYTADDSALQGTTSSGACRGCGGHKLRWSGEDN